MDIEQEHRAFLIRNSQSLFDLLNAVYQDVPMPPRKDIWAAIVFEILRGGGNRNKRQAQTEGVESLLSKFVINNPEVNVDFLAHIGINQTESIRLLAAKEEFDKVFGKYPTNRKLGTTTRVRRILHSIDGLDDSSIEEIIGHTLGRAAIPPSPAFLLAVSRLGLYLGGNLKDSIWGGLSGKIAESSRYKFLKLLEQHGVQRCIRDPPRCSKCELRRFCRYWRSRQNKTGRRQKPVVVDLFCGCGGATEGLRRAGFGIALAVDSSAEAIDTLYLNQVTLTFEQLYKGDIRNLELPDSILCPGPIHVLFGGPPCQGWSKIGKNRKNGNNGMNYFDDDRNSLFFEFRKWLIQLSPLFFVMENVPGLSSAHNGVYEEMMIGECKSAGYSVRRLTLNAVEYGVPQNRTRIFLLGSKAEHDSDGKHLDEVVLSIRKRARKRRLTFGSAMAGLPVLNPGEGANVVRRKGLKLQGIGPIIQCRDRSLILNHIARKHNARDLEIFRILKEGEDYESFSKRIHNLDLIPYDVNSFLTKFRKIADDKPSFTIISHLSKDSNSYIHPKENRGITVREAARIQSFPDDFMFLGSGMRQFVLVGNAVPPRVGEVIGGAIMKVLVDMGVD